MARKNLYPPSVTPGIPKYDFKPEGWIETAFGDVVRVVQRKVDMQDDVEYQLVIAKRNRGGIVPRSILKGKDILTKTQFYIKCGDFLIADDRLSTVLVVLFRQSWMGPLCQMNIPHCRLMMVSY